jgi:hypothetical protein
MLIMMRTIAVAAVLVFTAALTAYAAGTFNTTSQHATVTGSVSAAGAATPDISIVCIAAC